MATSKNCSSATQANSSEVQLILQPGSLDATQLTSKNQHLPYSLSATTSQTQNSAASENSPENNNKNQTSEINSETSSKNDDSNCDMGEKSDDAENSTENKDLILPTHAQKQEKDVTNECYGDGKPPLPTNKGFHSRPDSLGSLATQTSLTSEGKLSPFTEELGENSEELLGMRKKSAALMDAKEAAILRLQEELKKSTETLKLRDVEVEKLSKIRDEVGAELEELTASLFEEAHKMVHDANVKRAAAEKKNAEANLKIEMLDAEVQALKALVLTSTPSTPNHHLHPHISPSVDRKNVANGGSPGKNLANGGHKRASSHGGVSSTGFGGAFPGARSSFGAGGASTQPSLTPGTNAVVPLPHPCPNSAQCNEPVKTKLRREQMDPVAFDEFSMWIENPIIDKDAPFLARIFAEDVLPCFNFKNEELASSMLAAIEANTIVIEPLSGVHSALPKSSAAYGGRTCALSLLSKACNYKVRLEEESADGEPRWHFISDFSRNRVIAVCDFYTYVRYIIQGLVKKNADALDTFWRIVQLRRSMNLARLGFDPTEA